MSYSLHSASRATHFKIVALGLVCSVALTLFCLLARTSSPTKLAAPVIIKAKTRIVVTSNDAKATR
jgi:hypothetical protein